MSQEKPTPLPPSEPYPGSVPKEETNLVPDKENDIDEVEDDDDDDEEEEEEEDDDEDESQD